MADDGETRVRVAARVRPLLPREKAANCCSCTTVQRGDGQIVVGTRRAFAFDVVFDTTATQEEVYGSCVAPLLAGCMQGYNATVMAYGQTGSGKTFTLGLHGAPQERSGEPGPEDGVTHRAVRACFEHIERLQEEAEFKVSCCYMELYNEEMRDLLHPSTPKHQIAIRETVAGHIQVTGIRAEPCANASDMLRCLVDGSVHRTTGATMMNEQSSRSHSIFTMILEQRGPSGPKASEPHDAGPCEDEAPSYRTAKFHLVDLAGSERLKRTGAVGSRFRESVAINAGLLALGNVISALGDPAKRGSHVPYRDSKLTRLLQDSLGGNSRTWMIACASCADADFEETLNTLKYANRARNIQNKPVVNQDPQAAQLAAMQDEIAALRSELRRAGGGGTPGPAPPRAEGDEAEEAAARALGDISTKLEGAEHQNLELRERLAAATAECDGLRRALADLCATVRTHLPAIWQAPGGPAPAPGEAPVGLLGSAAAPAGGSARQALTAVCEALQAARPLLGDGGAAAVAEDPLSLSAFEPPGRSGKAGLDGGAEGASRGDGEARAQLSSLAETRADPSGLIRKYLDEIRRLEGELLLFRRRERQLQEELRQAKGDLQQDEEIFEEKMLEMRAVAEENEALRARLAGLAAAEGARAALRAPAPAAGAAAAAGSSAPAAAARAQRLEQQLEERLEQQIDERLRGQEAQRGLEGDRRKRERLLQKREQYRSYRQEALARLQALDGQEAPPEESAEPQGGARSRRSEARDMLQNIDERLEALQDEIDFREARVAQAQEQARLQAAAAGSLEEELVALPAEDARELLRRFCEKMVGLRQREKDTSTRLAVVMAQLKEKGWQASELQHGCRRQDESSARALEAQRWAHEAEVRALRRELEEARRGAPAAPAVAAPGSAGDPPLAEAAELEQLRRDNEYYRGMNRELKRRLKARLEGAAPGAGGGEAA